jgi:hypothetical protein
LCYLFHHYIIKIDKIRYPKLETGLKPPKGLIPTKRYSAPVSFPENQLCSRDITDRIINIKAMKIARKFVAGTRVILTTYIDSNYIKVN